MQFDSEVDAIGLKCPLPILKCKKAISQLNASEVLKISATDKGAVKDFQAFCKQTGHTLLEQTQIEDTFIFFIKKRET
jgi:tRNA 2-thiouridine synthesizing protein A